MYEYDISIIVPLFNREKFLDNAMESVINQTFGFERIEVVLIDDKSTDNTPIIMNKYDEKYENITCIYLEKNSGSAGIPRNKGVDAAKGEYIMFLDSDDIFDENICKVLYDTVKSNNKNIAGCRYRELKSKEVEFSCNDLVEVNPLEDSFFRDNDFNWFMVWDKIYKKDFIDKYDIKSPEKTLAEDVIFNVQAFLTGEKMILVNDYYGYLFNIGNEKGTLTRTFNKRRILQLFEGHKLVYNLLKEKNNKNIGYLMDSFFTSIFGRFSLIEETPYEDKIEILETIYQFESTMDEKIIFSSKWAEIFNNLLMKRKFNRVIQYSKILGYGYDLIIKFNSNYGHKV